LLASGVAVAAVIGAAPALAGQTIRINGSGSPLDAMSVLNRAFLAKHPDVRIEMEKPLGSSGAVKALLAGALDLVVSSKPLTAEQAAQGAVVRAYGRTPLAIVTERSVSVTGTTTGELEEIYSGKRRTWPNGEPVRLVLRPLTDVDTTILRGLSPGMSRAIDAAQAAPGMAMAITDPESNELVARMPGAIGATGLCSLVVVKPPLNTLTLNGVPPTLEALADGRYPLAKEISFVTRGTPSAAVTEFFAFLYSAEGRAIAETAGVLVSAGAAEGTRP
jgi:phosphate transport system substrate-binding protein